MRLILDTHAFLWFIEGSPELSSEARRWIEDPQCEKFLSVASAWEMTIKASIGKLSLGQPLHIPIPQQLQHNGFNLLPISLAHLVPLETLPQHHRDPFDRLLIAQSLAEGAPLLSADTAFDPYVGLTRLW